MRSDTITNGSRCCSQMLVVWLLQPVVLSLKHRPQSSGILAERLGKLYLLSAFSTATCQEVMHYVKWMLGVKKAEEGLAFCDQNLFFFFFFKSFIMPSLIVLPWSRVCLTKYVSLAPETSVVLFPTMALAICEGRLLTFH